MDSPPVHPNSPTQGIEPTTGAPPVKLCAPCNPAKFVPVPLPKTPSRPQWIRTTIGLTDQRKQNYVLQ
ncbi:uncharacterized protein P884DRAFT_260211, partial [Thermothelomyces heterothallicus CBS 202.75]|uniref:uncharacterized protein n=1 Tax=Thermothelomyces heterothallicus CBS 202.75 TaxID=1149848 RepID=UPI003743CA87